MGTILYLKNANFSANAIEKIDSIGIKLQKYNTPAGFTYMACFSNISNYNWGIRLLDFESTAKVAVFDVTDYQGCNIVITGKRLLLTDPSEGIHRSWYGFVESLKGVSLNLLATLSESIADLPVVSLLDPSPVSSEDEEDNYMWSTVVPQNARYLCMKEIVSLNNCSATIII